MKNLKIIQKAAIFFAVASTIFVVLSAIDTYYLIQIANASAAPTEYVALLMLSNVMPYLFLAVLSLVIAAISRGVGKESLEKEAPSPAKPTE